MISLSLHITQIAKSQGHEVTIFKNAFISLSLYHLSYRTYRFSCLYIPQHDLCISMHPVMVQHTHLTLPHDCCEGQVDMQVQVVELISANVTHFERFYGEWPFQRIYWSWSWSWSSRWEMFAGFEFKYKNTTFCQVSMWIGWKLMEIWYFECFNQSMCSLVSTSLDLHAEQ